MLAIFDTQINSIESELTALLAKVEAHREKLKVAKARQRKTTKLIDSLKGLISELPTDAITSVRDSILELFPSPQSSTTDDSSGSDSPVLSLGQKVTWTGSDGKGRDGKVAEVTPLGAVIDQGHVYKPWIEKEFLSPVTEPLADAGKNPEEQTFQGQPKKPVSDILIASSPDQLENAFSQVTQIVTDTAATVTPELQSEEQQSKAEDAFLATVINDFCSLVMLSPTVGYIRKERGQTSGEIMSSYVACSSQKLAKDWAELIILWGGRTEIRKAERLAEVAKYEIKIWDLSQKRINFLAEHHTDPSSPVPSFPSEFSKKQPKTLDSNAEKSSDGGGETTLPISLSSTAEETNEKLESSFLKLNETVAYIRKNGGQSDGEIMSAYLGCATQKLAKDWAECVKLWGATQTEVRKPQRITDAKWELKIWGLSFFKLTRLAEFHKSSGEAVPQAESTKKQPKKSDNIAEKSPSDNGETPLPINLNLTDEGHEEKPLSRGLDPQDEAAKDAEIIAAGELAKEELGLAEAPLNDTPMEGDFVRIVSGHYAGLSGEATTVSRKGGIIATEQGNRWVIWTDCEVTQKPLVR